MTCYLPLPAAYTGKKTKTGKNDIQVVSRSHPKLAEFPLRLPCGQCVGCRLEYSRVWAIRCMHEASLYDNNCFITLTYNDQFLPANGSLNYDHWVKFMKRLRKKFTGTKIRFFMGPEYGEKSGRPHYHALLFNHDFADKTLFKMQQDYPLFVSDDLNKLWSCPVTKLPYGFASVGSCTFESAAYVARYMMKKVKGEDHLLRYYTYAQDFNESGEIIPISPEKARMSRMPGIARGWFEYWQERCEEVYPRDYVIMNGRKVRPPAYYDKIYASIDADAMGIIKDARVLDAEKYRDNNTPDRLAVRLKVKESQISQLIRPLDI